jgi:hypothetical protein
MDGKAGAGILGAVHMVSGIYVSAYAMLRAEEGHKVHLRGLEEDVDGTAELAVYAAGVGNEAHPLTQQGLEAVLYQHFQAGGHLGTETQGHNQGH